MSEPGDKLRDELRAHARDIDFTLTRYLLIAYGAAMVGTLASLPGAWAISPLSHVLVMTIGMFWFGLLLSATSAFMESRFLGRLGHDDVTEASIAKDKDADVDNPMALLRKRPRLLWCICMGDLEYLANPSSRRSVAHDY